MKFSNLLISSNQNQALLFKKSFDSTQWEVVIPYMQNFDKNNNQKEVYFYRRVLEIYVERISKSIILFHSKVLIILIDYHGSVHSIYLSPLIKQKILFEKLFQ